MSSNVIKFPNNKKTETIEIEDERVLSKRALEFAYEMIDYVHDGIHEETGDCIFTDDEYVPMVICMAEVIASIYMLSRGHDHPFQEIANNLFGDVDIDSDMGYNEPTNIDELPNEDE